jgi:hypothetical protein
MKKMLFAGFLLFLLGCDQNESIQKVPATSQSKVIYKGNSLASSELKSAFQPTSILFNDYSKDKYIDYLFDSEVQLLEFISNNYDSETIKLMNKHFTEENPEKSTARIAEDWSDFSLQFYNTYCNTADKLCFLDPYYFPAGQINNIATGGCGYYAKSFGVGVPANGKMTLTYYHQQNCTISFDQNCYPSYRTILFNSGSHCSDVMLGSCASFINGIVKSQAASAKWSCSRTL